MMTREKGCLHSPVKGGGACARQRNEDISVTSVKNLWCILWNWNWLGHIYHLSEDELFCPLYGRLARDHHTSFHHLKCNSRFRNWGGKYWRCRYRNCDKDLNRNSFLEVCRTADARVFLIWHPQRHHQDKLICTSDSSAPQNLLKWHIQKLCFI